MSWISLDDESTGNPIGLGSNLTFTGSGDLENGWNVALSVAMDNKDAYSNTTVTVAVPSLGSILVSQGVSGTGIDRIDDVTPNVWEEAYGTGLGTGIKTVAGTSGGTSIEYTPNILPDGLTARIAYSPDAGSSGANDKGTGTADYSAKGSGFDVTLQATDAIHNIAGLTVWGGMSEVSQDTTVSGTDSDLEEQTIAVSYAAGGFTLGYQWSEQDLGVNTGAQSYENTGYGITFNVNDDLSVGYNNFESDQDNATDVTAEASSFQIAYSMGGASIRLAEANVKNKAYQTGAANDRDATTLSVSLAF
jgi:outer membrane protein OmpU